MNNEQYTAAEFVRGVTWTRDMNGAILIAGMRYTVGDLLDDVADTSGHDYRNEIFECLARSARGGDVHAVDLIKRMGNTFAMLNCPPEPEPEEPEYLKQQDRGEFDAAALRMVSEGATA